MRFDSSARVTHAAGGIPIIGLFARLSDAVGGGLCYHPECCAGSCFGFFVWNCRLNDAQTLMCFLCCSVASPRPCKKVAQWERTTQNLRRELFSATVTPFLLPSSLITIHDALCMFATDVFGWFVQLTDSGISADHFTLTMRVSARLCVCSHTDAIVGNLSSVSCWFNLMRSLLPTCSAFATIGKSQNQYRNSIPYSQPQHVPALLQGYGTQPSGHGGR